MAQTKKVVSKSTTKSLLTEKKSDEQIVMEKAEQWFKDIYVENRFKDPYSYRRVGLKALPVTLKESLVKDMEKAQNIIDTARIAKGSTQKDYDVILTECNSVNKDIEKENSFIESGVDVTYHSKRKVIYVEALKDFAELARQIDMYLFAIKEKESLLAKINNLTEEEASVLIYYDIRLDCYSKNSLGNEVLGRFLFPFTKEGKLGQGDGIENVIILN